MFGFVLSLWNLQRRVFYLLTVITPLFYTVSHGKNLLQKHIQVPWRNLQRPGKIEAHPDKKLRLNNSQELVQTV
jgi:hypothetical protein